MSGKRRLDLDELIGCVENALDSASIQVDVWETGPDGRTRTTLHSPEGSLRRLTRCLRSHGLLDEYTTTPTKEGSR